MDSSAYGLVFHITDSTQECGDFKAVILQKMVGGHFKLKVLFLKRNATAYTRIGHLKYLRCQHHLCVWFCVPFFKEIKKQAWDES